MTRRHTTSLEMSAPLAATIVLTAAFMTTATVARVLAPAPAAPPRTAA
jgi:hypothetical protein